MIVCALNLEPPAVVPVTLKVAVRVDFLGFRYAPSQPENCPLGVGPTAGTAVNCPSSVNVAQKVPFARTVIWKISLAFVVVITAGMSVQGTTSGNVSLTFLAVKVQPAAFCPCATGVQGSGSSCAETGSARTARKTMLAAKANNLFMQDPPPPRIRTTECHSTLLPSAIDRALPRPYAEAT